MKRPRNEPESEQEEQQSDIASEDEEPTADDDGTESEDNEKEASDTEPTASSSDPPAAKKRKRGIIYLSTIPKHMTVAIAREMFSQYATIGRMFFQPETKTTGKLRIFY